MLGKPAGLSLTPGPKANSPKLSSVKVHTPALSAHKSYTVHTYTHTFFQENIAYLSYCKNSLLFSDNDCSPQSHWAFLLFILNNNLKILYCSHIHTTASLSPLTKSGTLSFNSWFLHLSFLLPHIDAMTALPTQKTVHTEITPQSLSLSTGLPRHCSLQISF